METITYSMMMFELPISYEYIKECSITEKINEHVNVRIVGVLTEEEQMSALEQVSMESMVHIYTEEEELFYGTATNFEITYLNGVGEFVLCAADESIHLDLVKKSSSFQDINQTYAAIIKQTIGEYSGDFANASQYTVYPQAPIIQYEETDWEFIKRLSSYMGTYLQPEAKREGVQIYLGEHEGYKHSPSIYEYVGKSENQTYVIKEDKEYITKTQNSKSIWIQTSENYSMGDKIVMNQELYTIIEKTACIEKEQLLFTYRIKNREELHISINHNKGIKGISIEGTILAIDDDRIKLHLCIDETQDEENAYSYPFAVPYVAEGNTGWYMMPQIGENAFLYIPSEDENEAYISTVMHREGNSNPYMAEESVHSIGTEDDKSLVMGKNEISFQSENNEFFITMMEEEGIAVVSDEEIQLVAGKKCSLQGKTIKMYAKERITLTTKKTSIIVDSAVDISGDNQRKSVADELVYRLGAKAQATDKKNSTLTNKAVDDYMNDAQNKVDKEKEKEKNKEKEKKKDEYFVISSTNLTIRNTASTDSKAVSKLSPGDRFKIVLDEGTSKKITKKDSTGRVWIKIYHNGTKIGWIAEEYVLPDEPIETIPPEKVTGKFNGEEKILKPRVTWGSPGKGTYPPGVQKDSEGRYKVAVGPKILNPKYPDDGGIQDDDFKAFSRNIEVILEHKTTKKRKILNCVVTDFKAHTYSKYPDGHSNIKRIKASFNVKNGILQTGIAYPKSWNGDKSLACSEQHMNGTVIEFCGGDVDIETEDYCLIKVISNI